MKKEYTVYFRVNGRCRVLVEADNLDEAKSIAENKVGEYDFGNLEDIDWKAVAVEDKNGNYKMLPEFTNDKEPSHVRN